MNILRCEALIKCLLGHTGMYMIACFFTTKAIKYVTQFHLVYNKILFHCRILIIIYKFIIKTEMSYITKAQRQYFMDSIQRS